MSFQIGASYSSPFTLHSLPLHCSLYGILDTGYVAPTNMGAMAQKLLRGGVDIIQLRAKNSSEEEIMAMAQQILPWTRAAQVPFIINDYPHLVPLTGADGTHIGQEDMSVSEARALAGEKALIGLSTHSLKQATEAILQKPDYIGFGPLFATPTKPTYLPIGISDIRKVYLNIPFPVFCIGGITLETLPQVIEAGAKRVVIVSTLLKAEDPEQTTRQVKTMLTAPC